MSAMTKYTAMRWALLLTHCADYAHSTGETGYPLRRIAANWNSHLRTFRHDLASCEVTLYRTRREAKGTAKLFGGGSYRYKVVRVKVQIAEVGR